MALVLIVDDEELVRQTIGMMLRGKHQVVIAKDGEDALEQATITTPDVIITDIIMPEKEGVETIIDLLKLNPNLRIIAMSGGGRAHNFDYLQVAMKAGALHVLRKPFTKQELLAAVDFCLARTPD